MRSHKFGLDGFCAVGPSLTSQKQFDPALESLVEVVSAKFSAAFESELVRLEELDQAHKAEVGCQGEVKLYKDETHYDQWGIQIMVSYRDAESLSLLTAQQQSGGVSILCPCLR